MEDRAKHSRTSQRDRGSFREAAQYWERRRLVYNAFLFAIFAGWVVFTWPHFRPMFAPLPVFQLSVLALLANVCYSAAYLIDFAFQGSATKAIWRSGLWIAGTVFAIILENYWIADEIYPYVS